MKTEVYSWRVSSGIKGDLEREARRRKISVSAALQLAVRDWLQKSVTAGDDSAAASEYDNEQLRLHKAASRCLGALASGNARRSETVSQTVRERLRHRYNH